MSTTISFLCKICCDWKRTLWLGALALLHCPGAVADIVLADLFTENMVIQRDVPLPIWGTASPGEPVSVSFRGRKFLGLTDSHGKWRVTLPPQVPGGPDDILVEGSDRISVQNVLVGDVWLCGGQSNMEMILNSIDEGKNESQKFVYPEIRMLRIPPRASVAPLEEVGARWVKATPGAAGRFSAICGLFGRNLQERLHIPIGLIDASAGGTAAEAWSLRESVLSDPLVLRASAAYLRRASDFALHRPEIVMIRELGRGPHFFPPGSLWSGMIAPLTQLPVRGVVWYQGEANAGRAGGYSYLLSKMISDWRKSWGSQGLPFLLVQLPGFGQPTDSVVDQGWPRIREAQMKVSESLPNVALVTTLDLGDTELHPKRKRPIADRLARAARAVAYGEQIAYAGPKVRSVTFDRGQARLTYESRAGLKVCGKTLRGFSVAGKDRHWDPARAELNGNTVVVFGSEATDPVAVRYAWAPNPIANLCDDFGDPASPFRSDNWDAPGAPSGPL